MTSGNMYVLNPLMKTVGILSHELPYGMAYFNDELTESIQDNVSTLTFDVYATSKLSLILNTEGYIIYPRDDGTNQLFVIKEIEDSHEGDFDKTVFCENSAIGDTLGQIIHPKVFNNELKVTLNEILAETGWVVGQVPNNLIKEVDIKEYSTSLSALHEVMKIYDVEMSYRVEFDGTRVIRRYVDVFKERGEKTNKVFEYGINMSKVTRTEDTTNLVTALIGVGKDGITLDGFTEKLPKGFTKTNDYISNDKAFQQFNKRGKHIFGVFKDSESDNQVTLFINTLKKLQELSKPLLTYSCSIELFKHVAGYRKNEKVNIGDTVTIKDFNYSPPLILQARVVQMKTSKTNLQNNTLVLGDYKPLDLTPSGTIQAIQSKLDQVASNIANKEDVLYKQNTPPPHADGRMWLDTSVIPNVLKRSDGSKWITSSLSLDDIQNISKVSRNLLNESELEKTQGLFKAIGTTEISNPTKQFTKVMANNSIGEKGIIIEGFPIQKNDYNVSFDVRGVASLSKLKITLFGIEKVIDITSSFQRVFIPFQLDENATNTSNFSIKMTNDYVKSQGFEIKQVSVSKGLTSHDWFPSKDDEDNIVVDIENDIKDTEQGLKDYVQSRGENLITNGTGLLKDNTNFKSFIFDGSDSDNVNGSFVTLLKYSNVLTNDEFIPINPTSEYIFKYSIKSPSFQVGGDYYGFVNCYDTDDLLIKPEHNMFIPNTLTTLSRELKDGDTKVYLSSIANFEKDIDAYQKRLIFWNYKNSKGASYDVETYSRNVTDFDLWLDSTSFNSADKSITLKKPWSYGTFPIGTPLSQGNSGNAYKYIAGVNEGYTNKWVRQNGIIKGIDLTGTNDTHKFNAGTSKIKVGWLFTKGDDGTTNTTDIWLSNLSFNINLEEKIKVIDERVKSAELKITNENIISTVENSTLLQNKADIKDLEQLKKTSNNLLNKSSLKKEIGDMQVYGISDISFPDESFTRILVKDVEDLTGLVKDDFPKESGIYTLSFDVRGFLGVNELFVRLGDVSKIVTITEEFNRIYFTADIGNNNPTQYMLLICTLDGFNINAGFDIKNISLIKGALETSWSPSVNDIDEMLNSKMNNDEFANAMNNMSNNFMTQIDQRADSIKASAIEEAILHDENLKKEFETIVDQTSRGLRIDINTTKTDLANLDNVVSKTNSYFDFNGDNLTIGKEQSPLTVTISNEEMSFNQNGTSVAYINGRKMYIKDLQVLEELIIGVHKIEKYDNETTLIKWVGGNN